MSGTNNTGLACRAGTDRRLRRCGIVGAVFAFCLASPVVATHAQVGCNSPPQLDLSDPRSNALLKAYLDMSAPGWDETILTFGQLMLLGSLKVAAGPSARSQPVFARCEPLTTTSILDIQRLLPSTTNVSGSATGGASGGGGGAGTLSPVSSRSGDAAGEIITGYVDRGDFTTFHAFRWTSAGGVVDLGTLDPANNASRTSMATGMSADGSVIAGFSQISAGTTQHAFRWTAAGMVDLGAPAGAIRDSRALAVNAAGDVLVGDGVFADPNAFSGFRNGAFRWTAAGGFQNLGALEPGFFSVATDVSADGLTVVGQGGVQIVSGGSSTNGSRAFRWTSATGIVPIGPMAGHTHAIATGVSDNGQVVVGISSQGILGYNLVLGNGSGTAFRWTQTGGIQDLRQLLIAAGLNLTGVTLVAATSVSGDGQWIVGNAVTPTTPAGETRPFIAKYCDAAISGTCTPLGSGTTAASFALTTTSSTTLNVVAGSSATSTLTVTPADGFNQAVTFTCSGLPTASNCAFAPSSLTPNGAALSTTLTITTTAPTRASSFVWTRFGGTLAVGIGIAWLLLVHALFMARGMPARTRWIRPVVAACGAVLIVSCGGGGDAATNPPSLTGGTPAGTYPVTVTATSGSGATALSRTLTITLAVTR